MHGTAPPPPLLSPLPPGVGHMSGWDATNCQLNGHGQGIISLTIHDQFRQGDRYIVTSCKIQYCSNVNYHLFMRQGTSRFSRDLSCSLQDVACFLRVHCKYHKGERGREDLWHIQSTWRERERERKGNLPLPFLVPAIQASKIPA